MPTPRKLALIRCPANQSNICAMRTTVWTIERILQHLRQSAARILRRDQVALLTRRDLGGLLAALAKRQPSREEFEPSAYAATGMNYSDARRHIQLWVNWPQIAEHLAKLHGEAQRRGVPFQLPGYQRLLQLTTVARSPAKRMPNSQNLPPPDGDETLPVDVHQLHSLVHNLRSMNRELRGEVAKLKADLQRAEDDRSFLQSELRDLRRNAVELQVRSPTPPICNKVRP